MLPPIDRPNPPPPLTWWKKPTTRTDSLISFQLYDRLNRPGICICYTRRKKLLDEFKGEFDAKVIEAIIEGKKLRLIGDNVNYYVSVRDERSTRHGRMMNLFGSAILIRELSFPDLPDFQVC